ncbi:CD225/dispanin family protein [Crocinitomicaceae bacterium]|nr:CD225/dispanin family protein [Crocinitomicaceae bacterium]
MKYCSKCGAQNTGDAQFCVSCGQKFDTTVITQQPVATPTPAPAPAANTGSPDLLDQSGYQPKPPNHLVWGILTTLLCCLPFGIVSIVYASKVDSLYASKQYNEAMKASKNAATWAIVSAAIGFVFSILYFILVVAANGL